MVDATQLLPALDVPPSTWIRFILFPLGFFVANMFLKYRVFKPLSKVFVVDPQASLKPVATTDSAIELTSEEGESLDAAVPTKDTGLSSTPIVTSTKVPSQPQVMPAAQDSISALDRTRVKFVVSCWKLVNFTFMLLVGYALVSHENWLFQPSKYYEAWPVEPASESVLLYYQLGFSNYMYAAISMLFFEPFQKDFNQMMLHHVVTTALILSSWMFRAHRIGCAILLLHDAADPLMEVAKLALYSGYENVANVAFFVFASVFMYTRVWLYPAHVLYSFFERQLSPTEQFFPAGTKEGLIYFGGSLVILQIMHIVWSFMILKIIVAAVGTSGVKGDSRDED